MKVAIMQPYFFPYIGYFSLIQAVDVFVFYTDVQYLRRGWMNRNRILNRRAKEGWEYIHVPVEKAPRDAPLSEIHIFGGNDWIKSFRGQAAAHYSKAPNYERVMSLVTSLAEPRADSLAALNMNSLRGLCERLKIRATFKDSRDINHDRTLGGEERLIALAKSLKADTYINAIGGLELYSKARWQENGIQLQFLKPDLKEYPQGGKPFVPGLSILDILMWNSVEETSNRIAHHYMLI